MERHHPLDAATNCTKRGSMKTPNDIEDWLVLLAGAALGGTLVACFMAFVLALTWTFIKNVF